MYLHHGNFCPLKAENKAHAPPVSLTSQEMTLNGHKYVVALTIIILWGMYSEGEGNQQND